jgi:hypothetical protein
MDYRQIAIKALKKAEDELNDHDLHRTLYAALELRMCLESIIYDHASLYKNELSAKDLSTWQPRKLLQVLIDIDPYADQNASVAVGVEGEYGKQPEEITYLGTERVLSLKEIKKFYDMLGSYLHMPHLGQKKSVDLHSLKQKCLDLASIAKEVLYSPIFHINMNSHTRLNCGVCDRPIIKRLSSLADNSLAKCHNDSCIASYEVTRLGNDKFKWTPLKIEFMCRNNECQAQMSIWRNEFNEGTHWKCTTCGSSYKIILGVSHSLAND